MLVRGSVRAAARAGIQQAAREARVNRAIVSAYTKGSRGATENKREPIGRPTKNAAGHPASDIFVEAYGAELGLMLN